MVADGSIALIGLGAAGAALAVELVARGQRDLVVYDSDPQVATVIAGQGGIRHRGFLGDGISPVARVAASAADAVAAASAVIVTITADRHHAAGRALGPALPAGLPVLLHSGYVGGSKVFLDGLRAGGFAGHALVGETINTLHLSGAVGPGDVFIKGRKAWLEATALASADTVALIAAFGAMLPELAGGRSVLETGLNNPNPVGHVPALLGNLGLLGRDFGDVTAGVLHFDELRSDAVQTLCDALERERVAIVAGLGMVPLPIAEFSRRAYPAGARMTDGVLRFGTKLLARFFVEDIPSALVPMEWLARRARVETPVISAMITLASAVTGMDQRATGRTEDMLGRDWIDSQLGQRDT